MEYGRLYRGGQAAVAAPGFDQAAAETAAFMRKVYLLMASGLAVTGVVAMLVASSEAAIAALILNRGVFFGLIILELLMVMAFAWLAPRVSVWVAGALFYSYAIVNGLTLAVIFLVYTLGSIAQVFFITGGTFAAMSALGYATKRDLSGVGHFCLMGLFGLIIASVVNLFMRNEMIYWVTSCVGVVVFVGLTAYDTQKIKQLNVLGNAGTAEDHKEALHGALSPFTNL
jgi:uncharacterized protein